MRTIVINGESTSAIPPATGRGSWTQYLVNCAEVQGDEIHNLAQGGKKIQTIRSGYQTLDRPLSPGAAGNGVYFLFGCANDIVYGRSASQIYDDLSVIWYASRLYGFMTVAFTVMPSTAYTGAKQSVWNELNALIRSEPAKYDFLIEPDLALPDATDTTFYTDGLHTTPMGARAIFDLVKEGPLARM